MGKTGITVGSIFICIYLTTSALAQNVAKEIVQKKTDHQLQNIIDSSPAITGLSVIDLTTNETVFTHNETRFFPQASAIKIPILMEVFK